MYMCRHSFGLQGASSVPIKESSLRQDRMAYRDDSSISGWYDLDWWMSGLTCYVHVGRESLTKTRSMLAIRLLPIGIQAHFWPMTFPKRKRKRKEKTKKYDKSGHL